VLPNGSWIHYSFSHIAHGICFLWRVVVSGSPAARSSNASWSQCFLEAAWEILENSPFIINRYRQVTVSLGYDGDSVLNSLSDVVMMSLGFCLAFGLRPWQTVALFIAMELGCAWWVRDNLTLNSSC